MPVLTGPVHAHILTKPSSAGFAVIRLELIEPGAETCVYQAKACSPTDQPVRKFINGLGKIWFAHARASVCTMLLLAPGLVSRTRQYASCKAMYVTVYVLSRIYHLQE